MATLRQLRAQHHLTQEQLAAAAEVSSSTVYHIEAGKVRPRPSIVRRLARVLQVEPQMIDLVTLAPDQEIQGNDQHGRRDACGTPPEPVAIVDVPAVGQLVQVRRRPFVVQDVWRRASREICSGTGAGAAPAPGQPLVHRG